MGESISKFGHGGARPNSGGPRPGAGRPWKNRVVPHAPTRYDLRWYCVQARYGCDGDAAEAIGDEGYQVFAPTIFRPAARRRRNSVGALIPAREAGVAPLFRGYVFARFRLIDQWQVIRGLPSVETILGLSPDAPTPMPEKAIDLVRGMCGTDGCYHEDGDEPNSLVGALVRMIEGPMESFEGVCDWSSGERVRVLLNLFGRPCPITVDQAAVEVV